jgi:hypothetical protein
VWIEISKAWETLHRQRRSFVTWLSRITEESASERREQPGSVESPPSRAQIEEDFAVALLAGSLLNRRQQIAKRKDAMDGHTQFSAH